MLTKIDDGKSRFLSFLAATDCVTLVKDVTVIDVEPEFKLPEIKYKNYYGKWETLTVSFFCEHSGATKPFGYRMNGETKTEVAESLSELFLEIYKDIKKNCFRAYQFYEVEGYEEFSKKKKHHWIAMGKWS